MAENESPLKAAIKAVDNDSSLRSIINLVRSQIRNDHGQIKDEYPTVASISTPGLQKSSSREFS